MRKIHQTDPLPKFLARTGETAKTNPPSPRDRRMSATERKVLKAALALHRRRHPENLYYDPATYDLVKALDDACAKLVHRNPNSGPNRPKS